MQCGTALANEGFSFPGFEPSESLAASACRLGYFYKVKRTKPEKHGIIILGMGL